jgi:uncharacterized membrane protein YccC
MRLQERTPAPAGSSSRRLLRSAFRIERRAVDAGYVLRSSLGVAVSLAGGYLTGAPILAVAAATGALSTGIAALQGFYRTRAATMMAMALAMALSAIVGSLTASSPVASIVALALCGYAYGLGASLGQPASVIGINAAIALIIFGHYPVPPRTMLAIAFCVLAGGTVQTVLLALSWPLQRYAQERRALAAAYRDLAAYARRIGGTQVELPASDTLYAVRAILADPQPFGRRAATFAFQTLLDEAERIRGTLARIASTHLTPFAPLREPAADALGEIATALERGRAPENEALRTRLAEPCDDPLVRALFGQLRAAWRSASIPLRGISLRTELRILRLFPNLGEWGAILQRNIGLDTTFGRHAVRLGAVLALAGAIEHLLPLQRGYWIALTAAIVLRPDFTTTFSRGIARIAGTLVGVVVATAVTLAVPSTPHAAIILTIFFAMLSYATFQLNYALYSLAITAYVVFILSLLGQPEHAAVVNRVIATIVGGTLAMLSYGLWPTWESLNLRGRIADLLENDRLYVAAVFTGLIDPSARSAASLQALRGRVWRARAAAEESLERMLSEPESTHEMRDETALGIMAATQRIALANLTLWNLYTDRSTPALAEIDPFARAVDRGIAELVTAISTGAHARSTPALREAYETIRPRMNEQAAAVSAFLVTADRLVDSINTIADLLGAGDNGA